uniref:Putative glycosidase crf2 n=1 Tax=Anthurium amnicola TaxID=1678845 RepID=A0A1D1Z6F4_9ARAE
MGNKIARIGLLILVLCLLQVNAQIQCSDKSPCPESAPCCSEYGYCGTDRFCLGGCNPFLSFKPTSCEPNPICVSNLYTFDKPERLQPTSSYTGGTDVDFTYEGQPLFTGGNLILSLAKGTQGTRISTTRYLYYGRIFAKIKAARSVGIVTAFITMSNIKDEIDWEFLGYDLQTGQTNYFYRGYIDYTKGVKEPVGGNIYNDFHEYGIDWSQDQLSWLIDGRIVRTVKKSDTYNKTTGNYDYPQTPSRIQLSIWDAGDGPEGTKNWAGGATNWNAPDIQSPGYFYAQVQTVTVECYGVQGAGNIKVDPSWGTVDNSVNSYVYDANGNVTITKSDVTKVTITTPPSQGLPQSPDQNPNTIPNITGQYVPDSAIAAAAIGSPAVVSTSIAALAAIALGIFVL